MEVSLQQLVDNILKIEDNYKVHHRNRETRLTFLMRALNVSKGETSGIVKYREILLGIHESTTDISKSLETETQKVLIILSAFDGIISNGDIAAVEKQYKSYTQLFDLLEGYEEQSHEVNKRINYEGLAEIFARDTENETIFPCVKYSKTGELQVYHGKRLDVQDYVNSGVAYAMTNGFAVQFSYLLSEIQIEGQTSIFSSKGTSAPFLKKDYIDCLQELIKTETNLHNTVICNLAHTGPKHQSTLAQFFTKKELSAITAPVYKDYKDKIAGKTVKVFALI